MNCEFCEHEWDGQAQCMCWNMKQEKEFRTKTIVIEGIKEDVVEFANELKKVFLKLNPAWNILIVDEKPDDPLCNIVNYIKYLIKKVDLEVNINRGYDFIIFCTSWITDLVEIQLDEYINYDDSGIFLCQMRFLLIGCC